MSRTLAQERSEFVLQKLTALHLKKLEMEEFGKFLAGVPAKVLQNGFGQTLAFLQAKGKIKEQANEQAKETKNYVRAFDLMAQWLLHRGILTQAAASQALQALSTMDQQQYLYAQEEALAVLEWAKRYAGAGLFAAG